MLCQHVQDWATPYTQDCTRDYTQDRWDSALRRDQQTRSGASQCQKSINPDTSRNWMCVCVCVCVYVCVCVIVTLLVEAGQSEVQTLQSLCQKVLPLSQLHLLDQLLLYQLELL